MHLDEQLRRCGDRRSNLAAACAAGRTLQPRGLQRCSACAALPSRACPRSSPRGLAGEMSSK
eukprot:6212938-Pleurochrysis_carterae.AAC.10